MKLLPIALRFTALRQHLRALILQVVHCLVSAVDMRNVGSSIDNAEDGRCGRGGRCWLNFLNQSIAFIDSINIDAAKDGRGLSFMPRMSITSHRTSF